MSRLVNTLVKLNSGKTACVVVALYTTSAIALPAQNRTRPYRIAGGDGAKPVAGPVTAATGPPPDCIIALSPTAGPTGTIQLNGECPDCSSGLFVGGNSIVSAAGCGVQVNSTTPGSLWIEWGSIETNFLGDAASQYMCGTGDEPVGTGDPGCYDPTYPIVTMYPQPSPPVSDPFAYLNPPASMSCVTGNLYVITGARTTPLVRTM